MNNWFRSTFIAGVVLAGSVLASQAFATHFDGHVTGGPNSDAPPLAQFPSCTLNPVDIATICADLGDVAFFTLGDGSRCLCQDLNLTIVNCNVEDPAAFAKRCGGVGTPIVGGGTVSTTPSGPGSCRTIIGVFAGTVVSYEVCSALF